MRLEELAQELGALVLAGVVDRNGRQVGDRLQELLVLLLEDRGAEGVVDVDGADDLTLGHKRHRDDRAQVLKDHRLLALEAVVEAGVGRHDRLARRHHVLDDRP